VLESGDTPSPTAQRARTVIGRQVQHLARLVDDLLDVSRVTTGKVRLNRESLDLGDLVANAMTAWREAGRFQRHEVALDVSPVWINADETRVEQILTNLVGNALKYTPAGGQVTVRVTKNREHAVLEVADTGIGIPPGLIGRIFDLFVQGDRLLDRAQGGLGLGLTLVKALVALHGGAVDVKSAGANDGTVFTVRFPSVSAPVASRPVVTSSPHAIPGRRILIVEDNEDAREMLRLMLTLAGHDVHESGDGLTAVALAATLAPDVALVDVGLPGIDGYEVARRLRAGHGGERMLLVATTGYGQAEDRERALDAGFDAHLTKPVSPERLAEVINHRHVRAA
jgi:CheY-like chemotaxis protein